MNSKQIKAALKPMADFAPAVLAAAEIVKAAEEAEIAVEKLSKEKQQLESQIGELRGHFGESAVKISEEKQAFNEFAAAQAAKKKELSDVLTKINQEIKQAQDTFSALMKEYATIREQRLTEIHNSEKVLAGIKGEIERLKKQFAA